MKQISVEDIRFMRLRYKHDVALVRVLDELLEYREAEEQSDKDPVDISVGHKHAVIWVPGSNRFLPKVQDCKGCEDILREPIVPRRPIDLECGPQDPKQWREH